MIEYLLDIPLIPKIINTWRLMGVIESANPRIHENLQHVEINIENHEEEFE